MIKFFRKIRFQLLNQNKTGKYLKYAIGEIVLVVIGILIALQINTWNQNRIDKSREERVLSDISNEIKFNLKRLDYILSKKEEIVRNCQIFLDYSNSNPDWPDNLNFDSLIVKTIVSGWFYNPENGVLTEVLSSGKLELIRNDSLRYMITSLPALINQLQYEDGIVKDDLHNLYLPFLIEKFPIRNTNITESGDLGNEEANILAQVDHSKFKGNPIDLLSDLQFENNLTIQMMWVSYGISAYKNLKHTYEQIILVIEEKD